MTVFMLGHLGRISEWHRILEPDFKHLFGEPPNLSMTACYCWFVLWRFLDELLVNELQMCCIFEVLLLLSIRLSCFLLCCLCCLIVMKLNIKTSWTLSVFFLIITAKPQSEPHRLSNSLRQFVCFQKKKIFICIIGIYCCGFTLYYIYWTLHSYIGVIWYKSLFSWSSMFFMPIRFLSDSTNIYRVQHRRRIVNRDVCLYLVKWYISFKKCTVQSSHCKTIAYILAPIYYTHLFAYAK